MNEAKPYLLQIRKLDEMIMDKKWELEQMRHVAEGMAGFGEDVVINGEKHAMDKVQSSGNPQRMSDAVCSYVDVEKRMLKDIARWQAEKQERISILHTLPEKPYKVAHRIYVRGMSLQDVANDLKQSYSWATTMHGIALKHVMDALKEKRGGGAAG